MARVWPLILLAGCALLLVSAASADVPAGIAGEQTLRVSTGGDPLGALLDVSADDGATNTTPPWVGLFILIFGGLLGVLWMATVLLSILHVAGMAVRRGELAELPPFSYRETKDEARIEPRADRERRPSPRSSDWL